MSIFYFNQDIERENRYDMAKFMEFTDTFDPITSDFIEEVKKIPLAGNFVIYGQEQRPDKIARLIYGDFQYWWVIMVYNDITSVEELTTGRKLSYPRRDALENYYFSLKSQQLALE